MLNFQNTIMLTKIIDGRPYLGLLECGNIHASGANDPVTTITVTIQEVIADDVAVIKEKFGNAPHVDGDPLPLASVVDDLSFLLDKALVIKFMCDRVSGNAKLNLVKSEAVEFLDAQGIEYFPLMSSARTNLPRRGR